MPSLAFAIKIKPGKSDEVRQLYKEILRDRSEEEHQRRSAIGVRRFKVWHQHTPEDMFIVYLEADDLEAGTQQWVDHEDEHERWLQERLQDLTEWDMSHHASGPPADLIYDWHAEHGASDQEHEV